MPPIRSITSTKPMKTERTHEENQERAYIAASRRSDRSLEARVESARRASEIHKRRTGRSLRVTEQDVVNEEMYEEEDDDLPLQYRRLTAHLNTNSSDFNRRLAAYLTNHVAMRTALDQAITSSYAQQYPNGQPWSQGLPNMQQPMQQPWSTTQSPMLNQTPMSYQPQPNPMLPPHMMRSPTSYRQSPYPMPAAQGYRQNMPHQRTTSSSLLQEGQGFPQSQSSQHSPVAAPLIHEQRQASLPLYPIQASAVPVQQSQTLQSSHRSTSTPSLSHLSSQSEVSYQRTASVPPSREGKAEGIQLNTQQTSSPPLRPLTSQSRSSPPQMSFSPFSTTLPPETQMFFGSGFDPSDPYGFNFCGPTEKMQMQQPFYSYNPNNFNKPRNVHPSYDGMSQTLAPGALDTNLEHYNWGAPLPATTDGLITPFTPTYNYGFDQGFGYDMKHTFAASPPTSMPGSGHITPADREWATFIDPASWEETAT